MWGRRMESWDGLPTLLANKRRILMSGIGLFPEKNIVSPKGVGDKNKTISYQPTSREAFFIEIFASPFHAIISMDVSAKLDLIEVDFDGR